MRIQNEQNEISATIEVSSSLRLKIWALLVQDIHSIIKIKSFHQSQWNCSLTDLERTLDQKANDSKAIGSWVSMMRPYFLKIHF